MISGRDTIAAIATPPGRGGIGIVRVSGAAAPAIAAGIVDAALVPRVATRASFRGAGGERLDEGLALFFPAPHSYTGEAVLELHGHGSPAALALILGRCIELGARFAGPGEFTQRAFLNGKLDLAQAEGVADLIDAATASAARAAVRSLSGAFSAQIRALVDPLIELRALTEAALDFPDEDLDFIEAAGARGRLAAVRAQLEAIFAQSRQGALLRDGCAVVLIGQPNVGKSSLLNCLVGDDIAIVTDIPGTTRDTVSRQIEIGGIPLSVIDTAGLRSSRDPIETLGIERTWSAIAHADLALVVVDARGGGDALTDADRAIVARLPAALPRIVAHNKVDLLEQASEAGARARAAAPAEGHPAGDESMRQVWLSAKTGLGIDALRQAMLGAIGASEHPEGAYLARQRHLAALREARQHTDAAALHLAGAHPPLELFAEELRAAQLALDAITGQFTADDLLGAIFARFCIGK